MLAPPDDARRAIGRRALDFEARLIAEALVSVGKGVSYRKAGQEMRASAYRYTTQNGIKGISEWGGSVHRYLDNFGALVRSKVEHAEWPDVLLLDALPLRQRDYSEDASDGYASSDSQRRIVRNHETAIRAKAIANAGIAAAVKMVPRGSPT